MKEKRLLFIYISLFFIAIIISYGMTYLFGQNPTFDEAYSIALSKYSFKDIWFITTTDVHPPLYYFGLKIYTSLFSNPSFYTYRTFSVLGYILCILLGIFPIRRLWGNQVGILCILLLILLPNSFFNYINIRMYSWGVFFILASFIFSYDVYLNSSKISWAKLFIVTLGSLYIHNFAMLSTFFIFILLFIELLRAKKYKTIKTYFIISLSIIIIYLPWLIHLLSQINQVTHSFWIAPVTIHDLLVASQFYLSPKQLNETYSQFSLNNYILIIISLALFIGFIIILTSLFDKKTNKKDRNLGILTLIFFLLPIVFILCYSIYVKSIFLTRYISLYIGLFTIAMSLFIASIYNTKYGKLLTIVFITLITIDFGSCVYINFKRNGISYTKMNNSAISQFLNSTNHAIYANENSGFHPLAELSVIFPENTFYLITNNSSKKSPLLFNYYSGDTITLAPFKNIKKIRNINIASEFSYVSFDITNDSILNNYKVLDSIPRPYYLYKLKNKNLLQKEQEN